MILFLIFLGGVLVLLIYISCLAQNETTTLRLPLSFIAWALPIGILIPACHNQTASLNWIRVTKLFGWEFSVLILGLILYLLLGLVAVVKLTKYYFGALRRAECLFSVGSTLLFQGRGWIKLPVLAGLGLNWTPSTLTNPGSLPKHPYFTPHLWSKMVARTDFISRIKLWMCWISLKSCEYVLKPAPKLRCQF